MGILYKSGISRSAGHSAKVWIRSSLPLAITNSLKLIGYSSSLLTFPTGNDVWFRFSVIPSRDPAHTTCSSLKFSQKYFNDVIALEHDWISSKKTRVFPGTIRVLQFCSNSRTILFTSKSYSNISESFSFDSKFTYAYFLKLLRANSLIMYVLPHCLTPVRISGLRRELSFHFSSFFVISLYMIFPKLL